MTRSLLLTTLLLAASGLAVAAAPVTLKELDLLVRVQTPEKDILGEVTRRRLLEPIDAKAEKQLAADGASAALIAKLKAGNFAAAPDAVAAMQKHDAVQATALANEKKVEDAAQAEQERQRAEQERQRAALAPPSDKMFKLFDGKLLHLEEGELKPGAAADLHSVRYFALYFTAGTEQQGQKFTADLMEYYKKMKPDHPEFELIFVSADKNAAAMQNYVKTGAMPCPAVRFDKIDANIKRYAVSTIPWLLVVGADGTLIYPKSPDVQDKFPKEWTSPEVTFTVLDALVQKRPTVVEMTGKK